MGGGFCATPPSDLQKAREASMDDPRIRIFADICGRKRARESDPAAMLENASFAASENGPSSVPVDTIEKYRGLTAGFTPLIIASGFSHTPFAAELIGDPVIHFKDVWHWILVDLDEGRIMRVMEVYNKRKSNLISEMQFSEDLHNIVGAETLKKAVGKWRAGMSWGVEEPSCFSSGCG